MSLPQASFNSDEDQRVISQLTGKAPPPSNKFTIRMRNLFDGAPTCGGKEWRTLCVDEIVNICWNAAVEMQANEQQRHYYELAAHNRASWYVRLYRRQIGWRPDPVPTKQAIIRGIIKECYSLAQAVEAKHKVPHDDAGVEMSVFVERPRQVASVLSRMIL